MVILLLIDLFISAFFLLAIVFLATVLPWPWAVVTGAPLLAMFLVYLKLGRVESSMNENRREYEVFCRDNRAMVSGARVIVLAAGAFLIISFAGGIRMFPEGSDAIFSQFSSMESEIRNLRKDLADKSAEKEMTVQLVEMVKKLDEQNGKLESIKKELETPKAADRELVRVLGETGEILRELKGKLEDLEGIKK